jgi:hypothetical protein
VKDDNNIALTLGFFGVIGCACIATHSADPLWLLVFLLWIL